MGAAQFEDLRRRVLMESAELSHVSPDGTPALLRDLPKLCTACAVLRADVTAGSEATADSESCGAEACSCDRLARSRSSFCLARVMRCWEGVSKQSQRSPSCPHSGLKNWQKR
jgi:hypothetical protein